MYNLHAVAKPKTFDKVPSNTCGLATSVLIAISPASPPTCLVNVVICSCNYLIMAE